MKLSEYIESVLNDKSLTMTKAAQVSGVSASSISRLKSGASELTPNLAAKLSVVGFDYKKMFELDMQEKIDKTKKIMDD